MQMLYTQALSNQLHYFFVDVVKLDDKTVCEDQTLVILQRLRYNNAQGKHN